MIGVEECTFILMVPPPPKNTPKFIQNFIVVQVSNHNRVCHPLVCATHCTKRGYLIHDNFLNIFTFSFVLIQCHVLLHIALIALTLIDVL